MDLLEYLKSEPRARERANKNRAIGNLITKKYNLTPEGNYPIQKEVMADIVGEILLLDRYWRKHLKENPELRGSDYGEEDGTKDELEVEKQRELGYNV